MQFHLITFEGPDGYARAGGIATRVTGLARALVAAHCQTHLWFVGDPHLPGHEEQAGLQLHRWCQWISSYHPGGVYDGEEGKRLDYVSTLPPFLFNEVLAPALRAGEQAVILAEEWHTADAVLHLDWLLRQAGLRGQVTILWNANNTYSFERVDWQRLAQAAVICTVSRYMKHLMWQWGIDPLVIANGLAPEAFIEPKPEAAMAFAERVTGRTVFSKVARWHPDKRWMMTVNAIAAMKREAWRPLLVARGGVESHGAEVLAEAARVGLHVVEHACAEPGARGLLGALEGTERADILILRTPLDEESGRLLFHCSDAVLANSGHEPFGLVGLETMAVGGVACVGNSGEDYAVAGHNCLVLETNDPHEFIGIFRSLRTHRARTQAMRRAAPATAKQFTWAKIVERVLLPRVDLLAGSANGDTAQARTAVSTWPTKVRLVRRDEPMCEARSAGTGRSRPAKGSPANVSITPGAQKLLPNAA